MRYFATRFLIATFVFSIWACSGAPSVGQTLTEDVAANAEQAIRHVLSESRSAWNRGDITAYMKSHWRDEQTVHFFNDDITVGYSAIEGRYRARYPDPKNMGTISGSEFNVQILGPAVGIASGRWSFERGQVRISGVVTLVFRKIDGAWLIVHDHSTAVPEQE